MRAATNRATGWDVFDPLELAEPNQQYPSVSAKYQVVSGAVGLPATILNTQFPYDNAILGIRSGPALFPNSGVGNEDQILRRLAEQERRLNSIHTTQLRLLETLASLSASIEALSYQRIFSTEISALSNSSYELARPISVAIEGNGEDFTATFLEGNISGSGETEADAIASLKDAIVSVFEVLSDLSEDRLGPLPLRQKAILGGLLRRLDE